MPDEKWLTEQIQGFLDELDVPYIPKDSEREVIQSIVTFILGLNVAKK